MGDCSPEHIAALTPLQAISWAPLKDRGIHLSVKREDLIHPGVSGNKLYKLFHHLQFARQQGVERLVSFGGAYSNHLHALAISGQLLGIETVAVIRGERPPQLSATLIDCEANGMQLKFVSRQEYKRRHDDDYLAMLKRQYGSCHIVPEGGGGTLGAQGCSAIARAINDAVDRPVDSICTACGTGTTLAGLIVEAEPATEVIGIAVLKAAPAISQEATELVAQLTHKPSSNWRVESRFHGGGYAKLPEELKRFIVEFEEQTLIPLDPIYTVKLFWGIKSLAEQGYWPKGSHVVAIHTGGLQGRRGFNGIWQ
ncbi:1-aminocyclopropane-1-carboxylate deaminase/D-cysteine desulfhydrase [Maricurvus nonylphenolicus]|uniref:1-aminocyclopropane-1-carboxylate deaminase/D-cysteine desulfhydrase n=1 Tax=Maricurvus nonylphenolicus TaxID=1008307 RepID=UPI0036F29CBB